MVRRNRFKGLVRMRFSPPTTVVVQGRRAPRDSCTFARHGRVGVEVEEAARIAPRDHVQGAMTCLDRLLEVP
jgi:hypothetical protein